MAWGQSAQPISCTNQKPPTRNSVNLHKQFMARDRPQAGCFFPGSSLGRSGTSYLFGSVPGPPGWSAFDCQDYGGTYYNPSDISTGDRGTLQIFSERKCTDYSKERGSQSPKGLYAFSLSELYALPYGLEEEKEAARQALALRAGATPHAKR